MNSVQFEATVNDGVIIIPDEYKEELKGVGRVTIVTRPQPEAGNDLIQQLMENPLRVDGFIPLTREEIYERR
jgi:hypothetical protein